MRCSLRTALILGGGAVSAISSASFNFVDFSDVSGVNLNGTAHQVDNFVRMTDDQISGQAGNMMVKDTQAVVNGFTTDFLFRCDGQGQIPADGIGFVVQTTGPNYLGNGGGDNGVIGDATGYVAVNFQSFWRKVQFIAIDPDGNLLDFQEVNLDDLHIGDLHRSDPWHARIQYIASTSDWLVSLDGTPVLAEVGVNLSGWSTLIGGESAWVGIGGGTGLGYDNNDVLSWSMDVVPEPTTMAVLGLAGLALVRRRRA